MSRLFTFGCSFTNYCWSTWADCLAPEFDEFKNWGQAGAGNPYIFNSVMEADQQYVFNNTDTVVVCWTNIMREDRYVTNRWVTLGNIMTSNMFSKEFVTDAVCERGSLIRDMAMIKAVKTLLENKPGLTWRFLSLCSLRRPDPYNTAEMQHNDVFNLYANVIDFILPSYIDILGDAYWYTDKEKRFRYAEGGVDYHPTPEEHLKYLDTVLPGWVTKSETRVKIHEESINLNKDPRKTGMTKVTRL
jgi:hypothetical protein